MPDGLPVGRQWPQHDYEVGREKIREYADAIGIGAPWYHDNEPAREIGFRSAVAPPTFAAVYVGPAVAAVMFDPDVGIFDSSMGLAGYRFVQRTQRFDWGVPVCSGDTISTTATLLDGGESNGRAWRTFGSTSVNGAGEMVVQGHYEGVVPGGRLGRREAASPAPEQPTRECKGPVSIGSLVEGDMLPTLRVTPDPHAPIRYAGASGDFTPFHLDAGLARAVGLGGIIMHGLHTFALLARALCEPVGDDPRVLRSLSVRFRRPAVPAAELEASARVAVAEGRRVEMLCSVSQGGRPVLADGRAVLSEAVQSI